MVKTKFLVNVVQILHLHQQCIVNSKGKYYLVFPIFKIICSHGSLAQIDELGRYKPLFNKEICGQEELPGRGRLRSAIDRYLNQSAAKESEMADEVAKLIINDIQQMVAAGNSVKRG